jgi:methionine-rich copper-binding protein CopC
VIKSVVIAWIVAATLASGTVYAHAKLLKSSPADNEQLTQPPRSLTLNFNKAVRLAMVTVTAGGKKIALAVDRDAKAAAAITVGVPALPAGKCLVQWSAVSPSDGHVMRGVFSFTVLARP